ncbi:MAG: hypothetical protein ACYCVL_06930 [Gemmatimonadaceae bacterium]
MMRRFLALALLFVGLAVAARPASAQGIAPLPSGVTLRIHGPQTAITGVLQQQSMDSVWLRPRGANQVTRSIAVPLILRVEQARPAYTKSILVGTALGIALGAALYPVTSHNDHDVVIGLSVIAGAVTGIMFPHTDWVPVPLR